MKLRIFTTVTLAALFIAGCSNNGNGPEPEPPFTESKSVYIKIKNAGTDTRAVEPTATDTEAILYSALVYFLDGSADPVVFDVRTVGGNGADLSMDDLEAGYKFDGIPTSVTQVYIVGNYNSTDQANAFAAFPQEDGTLLSQIKAVVLDIQQVSHSSLYDGTATNGRLVSVMDGQATIVDYLGNEGGWNGDNTLAATDLYANVVVAPLVSRIEIEELSYEGELASFTVEGIYINNYFAKMPVSLNKGSLAPVNNGSDLAPYQVGGPDFAYTYYMTLYDILGEGVVPVGGAATIEPAAGNVWAYQVFGNSNPVPHIIIKFEGVRTGTGTLLDGPRFLTVKGFMNGAAEVTTFEKNTIYKIVSLEFSEDDLDIYPETESKSVWVHVEVEPWNTIIVTPII